MGCDRRIDPGAGMDRGPGRASGGRLPPEDVDAHGAACGAVTVNWVRTPEPGASALCSRLLRRCDRREDPKARLNCSTLAANTRSRFALTGLVSDAWAKRRRQSAAMIWRGWGSRTGLLANPMSDSLPHAPRQWSPRLTYRHSLTACSVEQQRFRPAGGLVADAGEPVPVAFDARSCEVGRFSSVSSHPLGPAAAGRSMSTRSWAAEGGMPAGFCCGTAMVEPGPFRPGRHLFAHGGHASIYSCVKCPCGPRTAWISPPSQPSAGRPRAAAKRAGKARPGAHLPELHNRRRVEGGEAALNAEGRLPT
jgi:hypothetical protein